MAAGNCKRCSFEHTTPTFDYSLPSRECKRVLISNIEASIRPHPGEEILESCLEPAGATPTTVHDLADRDDEFSDTDLSLALKSIEDSWEASGVLQSSRSSHTNADRARGNYGKPSEEPEKEVDCTDVLLQSPPFTLQ